MKRLVAATAFAVTLCLAPAARAFDVRLDSDTSFQVYEVRSPGARAFMARRRLLSNLSLTVSHDLTEPTADGTVIRVAAGTQLRLEQEFGETCLVDRDLCVRATDATDPGAWQPLAADTRLDVPAVWVEVSGLPLGVAARAGRQLVLDTLGFARFDGVSARVVPTPWIRAEVVAGLLVRGTTIGGTARSDPQGSLRLLDADAVPWAAPGVDTWVAGASVAGGPGRWLQGSATFRQMWEPAGAVVSRLGAALSSQPADWLRLDATGVWDFLTAEVIEASARATLGRDDVIVRLGAARHVPRFDPGTIWAWFAVAPINDAELSVRWQATQDFALGGALRGRHAELGDARTDDVDGGLDAWVQARWEGFELGVSGFGWSGALGPLAGVSLDLKRRFFGFVELELDVSGWHFDDPNRPDLYGAVLSEVLAARFRIVREVLIVAEVQHATSRVVGHRFRGLLAVRVETWR
ncbi:MAG: hypothetical protein H6719_00885 [Sandaracinaceae bacterium]|nr:hypothetical protein [Sandaracinaceae bacterium]